MAARVLALRSDTPVRQGANAAIERRRWPPQPLTLDLSHDLHHPPIDGIALPGQLRQLLKQRLRTLRRRNRRRLSKGGRRHNPIKTAGTDNPAEPRSPRLSSSPGNHRHPSPNKAFSTTSGSAGWIQYWPRAISGAVNPKLIAWISG